MPSISALRIRRHEEVYLKAYFGEKKGILSQQIEAVTFTDKVCAMLKDGRAHQERKFVAIIESSTEHYAEYRTNAVWLGKK